MQTKILSSEELAVAATLLQNGDVVAFPTETVYGLGALIFDPLAIQKIFTTKGRPSDNPLIAHVSDFSQVASIAVDIPEDFYRLAKAFWPGPLTMVLQRHPAVPYIVTAGLDSIGVRMPKHPLALELIRKVKGPIVAPSANLSGRPSPTKASHVLEDLNQKIPAILDGGDCDIGIESTVISLKGGKPVILRPGKITRAEIEEVLKKRVDVAPDNVEKPLCPGMKYRHYAPHAQVKLFDSLLELKKEQESLFHERILVLGSEETKNNFPENFFSCNSSNLYSLFRQADSSGYRHVFVYCDHTMYLDEALMNRLKKASFC